MMHRLTLERPQSLQACKASSRPAQLVASVVNCQLYAPSNACSTSGRCFVASSCSLNSANLQRVGSSFLHQTARGRRVVAFASSWASNALPGLTFVEGYTEVEEIKGIRLLMEAETPKTEYLVKWKDGSADTWEPAINLSEDLIRDYETKWWEAARKGDLQTLAKMLAGGREVLSVAVDENKRSALHFAAALGNVDCTKLLVEAGADPNLQDKDGYTPLHMSAGYMHISTMTALLELGASPQLKDNAARDVVSLVDNLRNQMPLTLGTVQRRLALEEVCNTLMDRMYDEVAPGNIMEVRLRDDGNREFLVSFDDGRDDEWIEERNMAPDVLEDWQAGLEYARAEAVIDVVQVRTERRFKIRWSDGYPPSWEPEEHVPEDLIVLFRQQNPELFETRVAAANDATPSAWGDLMSEYSSTEYTTQAGGAKVEAAKAGVAVA